MDCFDKNVHILDQNSSKFSVENKVYQPRILSMLRSCFPDNQINSEDYFNTPNQRILCLFLTNVENQIEIIGVCFIRQIRNDACFVHSVCIRKNRQGQKCCNRLFSYLVKNYGMYNLVLSVKVDKDAEEDLYENNIAMKCYSKHGFILMDDGLNCKMIRHKK